jgi:hypothetical protein
VSVLSVLIPALFAGLVAVAVTVAVERLGGLTGGLLGTLPSTIVPAAIGIHATASPDAFELAMYVVGPGMFLNALFLLVWGALPPRLPTRRLGVRLSITLVSSLALWFVGAVGVVVFLRAHVTFEFAVVASTALVVVGLFATARSRGTPRAQRRVGATVLVARGVAASIAIGAAVVIAARGGDVAAGVASVFPAIFLTTMVALWLAHGEAVPGGAVGPMMVGSTSVAAYAIAAAWAIPNLGVGVGAALAWVGVAIGVQLPLYFAARRVLGTLQKSTPRAGMAT